MPRHPICDAHEWINEIPTVPNHTLAKPQPRERAWHQKAGKEDPVELDSSLGLITVTMGIVNRREGKPNNEIPLPSQAVL